MASFLRLGSLLGMAIFRLLLEQVCYCYLCLCSEHSKQDLLVFSAGGGRFYICPLVRELAGWVLLGGDGRG